MYRQDIPGITWLVEQVLAATCRNILKITKAVLRTGYDSIRKPGTARLFLQEDSCSELGSRLAVMSAAVIPITMAE
jgi:hypothetical protein